MLRLAISLLLCGLWGCSWGANKDFLETVKGASRKSLQQIIGYGDALLKENDTEGALVYYMVAANRIKPNMDKAQQRLCATANLKAGNVYYNKGRYADALQFYTKGLKIGEACDDKQLTGELYKNIGNIYCEFYDYAMGLSYFKQGYKIAHQYDTRDLQHRFLVNMTSVCTMMGDIKAAKKYYAESEKTKNPSDMVNVFMGRLNLGNILDSEHHYARSIPIYKQLVSYGMKHAVPPRYVCTAYQQIYLAYMQLNRLDSALYYAKACSQTAAKSGLSDKFIATMEHFAEIYERMGNGALASKYKSVYLKRRDSIYNMREYNRQERPVPLRHGARQQADRRAQHAGTAEVAHHNLSAADDMDHHGDSRCYCHTPRRGLQAEESPETELPQPVPHQPRLGGIAETDERAASREPGTHWTTGGRQQHS